MKKISMGILIKSKIAWHTNKISNCLQYKAEWTEDANNLNKSNYYFLSLIQTKKTLGNHTYFKFNWEIPEMICEVPFQNSGC